MSESKSDSLNWILGAALLLIAAFVLGAIVMSNSQADDVTNTESETITTAFSSSNVSPVISDLVINDTSMTSSVFYTNENKVVLIPNGTLTKHVTFTVSDQNGRLDLDYNSTDGTEGFVNNANITLTSELISGEDGPVSCTSSNVDNCRYESNMQSVTTGNNGGETCTREVYYADNSEKGWRFTCPIVMSHSYDYGVYRLTVTAKDVTGSSTITNTVEYSISPHSAAGHQNAAQLYSLANESTTPSQLTEISVSNQGNVAIDIAHRTTDANFSVFGVGHKEDRFWRLDNAAGIEDTYGSLRMSEGSDNIVEMELNLSERDGSAANPTKSFYTGVTFDKNTSIDNNINVSGSATYYDEVWIIADETFNDSASGSLSNGGDGSSSGGGSGQTWQNGFFTFNINGEHLTYEVPLLGQEVGMSIGGESTDGRHYGWLDTPPELWIDVTDGYITGVNLTPNLILTFTCGGTTVTMTNPAVGDYLSASCSGQVFSNEDPSFGVVLNLNDGIIQSMFHMYTFHEGGYTEYVYDPYSGKPVTLSNGRYYSDENPLYFIDVVDNEITTYGQD